MPYATTSLRPESTVIVLPIGRRSPIPHELADTLLLVVRAPREDDQISHAIAEYVHEIGAMAVIA